MKKEVPSTRTCESLTQAELSEMIDAGSENFDLVYGSAFGKGDIELGGALVEAKLQHDGDRLVLIHFRRKQAGHSDIEIRKFSPTKQAVWRVDFLHYSESHPDGVGHRIDQEIPRKPGDNRPVFYSRRIGDFERPPFSQYQTDLQSLRAFNTAVKPQLK